MKYETWKMLKILRDRQGKEFGKLAQKLLALAFIDAGAGRLTDRAVQGIDIEVELDNRKLAFEVKTAEGSSISLGKKDLDGLAARREEGFETMLAVLGGRLTDEWMFVPVPGSDLQASADIESVLLRPFMDVELGRFIEEPFVQAVDRYGLRACEGGQLALNQVLEKYPGYALA